MGESSGNANADDLESDTEDLGFPNLNVNDWLLVKYTSKSHATYYIQ